MKIIDKISNIRNFFILMILSALLIVILDFIKESPVSLIQFEKITKGTRLLDMTINYSPEKAYEMMESYGKEGRRYYLHRIEPIDTLLPASYSLFLTVIITLIFKMLPAGKYLNRLQLVPILAGLFDYLENCCIIIMLLNYPARLLAVAKISNVFTMAKTILILLSILIIFTGLVLLLFNLKMEANIEKARHGGRN